MEILFKAATNLLSQDDSVVPNLPPLSITPAVNANIRKDVAAGDNDTSG